ncbi:acyl-CoA dehydrogenase family protein [Cytobacillus sp. FSL R5-0569]|uniref:acyl-CoA dehydrogenase family protein n=1 Tax=Cytobacillus TaxID=2675230 RepID=UPI0027842D36|nr:acyl-CoA dehydrogenase family protein [Cytobacillus kochii]MDQ0185870.1 alkylation response protein AidB-like acyl-CoA dehydrogenase [Cytobacillus kochii]
MTDKAIASKGPIAIDSHEMDEILTAIAQDARKRREENSEARPFYALRLIKEKKIGALRVPKVLGGGGIQLRELLQVVIRLAEADPDVAHLLRSHFSHVERLLQLGDETKRQQGIEKIVNGEIIGNAYTEISKNAAGSSKFETTLTESGENFRLNGTKYFCTGTMYADWVSVMAETPTGKVVSAFIPTDREGVIIKDDWDGFGQKGTGSGTTIFKNVTVYPEEMKELQEDKKSFNAFLQLILQAVIAGIVRNVVTDAKELVHKRKRTFSYAPAEQPKDDPLLQHKIGEIASIAFAVEATVLAAAEALEKATNKTGDYELDHEASLQAAKAKVVVDELALKAATLLFEVGGASATKQSAYLDRHWRNIRTISSHNPTVYKAQAVGKYIINDEKLPVGVVYF